MSDVFSSQELAGKGNLPEKLVYSEAPIRSHSHPPEKDTENDSTSALHSPSLCRTLSRLLALIIVFLFAKLVASTIFNLLTSFLLPSILTSHTTIPAPPTSPHEYRFPYYDFSSPSLPKAAPSVDSDTTPAMCPQAEPLPLSKNKAVWERVLKSLENDEVKEWEYDALGGAIKIQTVTYEDMLPPGRDTRWHSRLEMHRYLEETYPRVHANLKKTVVNQYALVYEWRGSDRRAKPVLLVAHQDTVPVDSQTFDTWVHPPFSGRFDGEWIWGRGSVDNKASLSAIMIAIESLLSQGFQPTRTVVLAFGMDKEAGGIYGGSAIRNYLLRRYLPNGFSIVLDEGDGFEKGGDGILFARFGIAEKGALDVKLEVEVDIDDFSAVTRLLSRNGDSDGSAKSEVDVDDVDDVSLFPRRNAISLLTLLLSTLDSTSLPTYLRTNPPSPTFQTLQCLASHDSSFSSSLHSLVDRLTQHPEDEAARRELERQLLRWDDQWRWKEQMGSTKEFEMVSGEKRRAWAVVRGGVADWSSAATLQTTYISILAPLATYLNLSFSAFERPPPPTLDSGSYPQPDADAIPQFPLSPPLQSNVDSDVPSAAAGNLKLSVYDGGSPPWDPSPVSPTWRLLDDGGDVELGAWEFLSGVVMGALNASETSNAGARRNDKSTARRVVAMPELYLGNTDSRWYRDLTPFVYRYTHLDFKRDTYTGNHRPSQGVNEAIRADAFVEMVKFFVRFVLAADESEVLGRR